ncbi:MAG: EF-hand domain-containing protein [Alphaproteobacteria bacterium]|nr:EF-hand domain-containing protein [Alphaproteobacteria bacterium]
MKKFLVLCAVSALAFSANAQPFDLSAVAQEAGIENPSAEAVEEFSELDADNNGFLSEDELLKFQQTGLASEKDETYKVFDADNNGKVNKEEYKEFFKNKAPQNVSAENLDQIFADMDTDNDGNLSAEELKAYRIKNLAVQNREIFKLMDLSQDGKVSPEEYAKFMALTKSILGNIQEF